MTDEVIENDATLSENSATDEEVIAQSSENEETEHAQVEEAEKPKKEFWAKKRIDELTREKYEAKREAEQAIFEAQQLREALNTGSLPPAEVQTLVQQEAARIIAEQSFNDACNKTYAKGVSEFKDFDNAVASLQMIQPTREFFEIVSSSDVGAKILHNLGNDLDEAARISSLPPVQMARELTKLEFELGNKPAQKKEISKAPSPIRPINAAGATSKDPAKMTDSEFAQWRREQIKARNG